jgi:lipoate-protein ligase A
VISFLQSLGINSVFEGKNDLTVDGLKISGNAEHVFRERVLHHGTLLFDASLNNLRQSLKARSESYQTRGVESNRSSVTNLKDRLKDISDTSAFAGCMFEYFAGNMDGLQKFSFTVDELTAINDLANTKYKTWEWNYAYGPPYTLTVNIAVSGAKCLCSLLVKDGIIWACDIDGVNELKVAWKKLIGVRHMFDDILQVLREENIQVSDEEVYKLF